jgi:hypothetical protein
VVISLSVRLSDIDPNAVRPGWVALLVVLALVGATILLWRNMGKQLRKIDFDEMATGEPRKDDKDAEDKPDGQDETKP